MKNTTCKNCGGDEAIHHYETNQCPVGGYEAPIGRKQEWKSTTFEAANHSRKPLGGFAYSGSSGQVISPGSSVLFGISRRTCLYSIHVSI